MSYESATNRGEADRPLLRSIQAGRLRECFHPSCTRAIASTGTLYRSFRRGVQYGYCSIHAPEFELAVRRIELKRKTR